MPNSVERALADALSLEHPDIPWTAPAVLPSAPDLLAALASLTVAPTSSKHAAWCLSKLTLAFEPTTRLDAEATKLRAAVWLEACADLGDALWSKATLEAIRSSKWMPKPSEFRALVDKDLADRTRKIQRCRAMMEAQGKAVEAAAPAETTADRMRTTIELYTKHGRIGDADRVRRELDRLEGRGPPVVKQDTVAPVERGPYQPADTPQNRRLADLAAASRGGAPAPEYRDVAEAG